MEVIRNKKIKKDILNKDEISMLKSGGSLKNN
jgi:hypothetical protein